MASSAAVVRVLGAGYGIRMGTAAAAGGDGEDDTEGGAAAVTSSWRNGDAGKPSFVCNVLCGDKDLLG